MKRALASLTRIYRILIFNIAFIPTIITIGALVLAIFMLYIENLGYTDGLEENIGFALVQGADNARMILATIIGGILSLTVFSFSMVMVVLNRTTASLSPRVLPQLIAQKSHQLVLGYYMGTIVYSLVLIINVDHETGVPSFAILISMLATIGSLGLFIYFIHSISRSIQVGNILHNIYKKTLQQIEQIKSEREDIGDDHISWKPLFKAPKPGYYLFAESDELIEYLDDNGLALKVIVFPEQFVLAGEVIAEVSDDASLDRSEKLCELCFNQTERPEDFDNYVLGFQKISEIAIKALSPGINDPGTAIRAIQVLILLFSELLPLEAHQKVKFRDGRVTMLKANPLLGYLLDQYISSISHYARGQFTVVFTILDLYKSITDLVSDAERKVVKAHYDSFLQDCTDQDFTAVEKQQLREKSVTIRF